MLSEIDFTYFLACLLACLLASFLTYLLNLLTRTVWTVSTENGKCTTKHCLERHGQFNSINPKTLSTAEEYQRRKKGKNEQKKKRFELWWRKSRQDKHVDSTLCKTNWKGNKHNELTENLETVFNSIMCFNYVWKRLWLTKPKYYKTL